MNKVLEGKYFEIYQISNIEFIIKNLKSNEFVCNVSLLGKSIILNDINFNTIRMFDNIRDTIDVYEMTMEYINCVDFAKQSIVDTLNKN